jgi:cell division septation protein DedD
LTPPLGSSPSGSPPAPTPLGPPPPTRSIVVPGENVLFRVQVGAFISRDNAEARAATLREEGYDAYVSQTGALWKVQVGAFSSRENADRLAAQLKAAGYEVLITP